MHVEMCLCLCGTRARVQTGWGPIPCGRDGTWFARQQRRPSSHCKVVGRNSKQTAYMPTSLPIVVPGTPLPPVLTSVRARRW